MRQNKHSSRRLHPLVSVMSFLVLVLIINTPFIFTPGKTTHAAAQATYYVSPTGNDNNPGTKSQPFKSVQKARDVVRTINKSMKDDIVIYLRGGIYPVTDAVAFNEQDSGTNNHNIVYQAYSDEQPVLDGGLPVTGWSKVAGKSYYEATVSGVDNFRQLYVNSNRVQRATSKAIRGKNYDKDQSGIYLYSSDLPHSFARPQDLEYVQQSEWSNIRAPIIGVEFGPTLTHILFKPGPWAYIRGSVPGPGAGNETYLENALEFLDTAGEWYFNRESHKLYYYPKGGEDINTVKVTVPRLERFFTFAGSSFSSKVHNIQIKGLLFRGTSWLTPSENGALNVQSTIMRDERGAFAYTLPASIEVNYADALRFERNTFINLGNTGINLIDGVSNISIEGNLFRDISGAGISVGTWNYDAKNNGQDVAQYITIKNNLLREIGLEYWGSVAINTFFTRHTVISHNDIRETNYSGISNGWFDSSNVIGNDNDISYNRIRNVMRRSRDGGGIYTLGKQEGSNLHNNYIVNINNPHPAATLYHDQDSSGWNDHDNVVDPGRPDYLSYHFNQNGTVRSNNLYTTNGLFVDFYGQDVKTTNTFIYLDANWPAAAQNIIRASGLETPYQNLLNKITDPPITSNWNHTPIQEEDNQVVVEAESFTGYVGQETAKASWLGAKQWFSGYSGQEALLAYPDGFNVGTETTGPRVDYKINFTNAGTYTFYLRAKVDNANTGAVLIGLDGRKLTTGSSTFNGFSPGTFSWTSLYEGKQLTINIPNTGEHTINIWASQSGAYIDKFILTKTADLLVEKDTVIGPIENRRVGGPLPMYSSYPAEAEPELPNIAQGKPATASSSYSDQFGPGGANDGSLATEWVAKIDDRPAWWQIDLQTARQLTSVEFVSRQGFDLPEYRKNFEIRASNDSTFATSTVLYKQDSSLIPFGKTVVIQVTNTTPYRYVRVVKTDSHESFALGELRVYGADIFDTLDDLSKTTAHSDNWRIEQANFEQDRGKAQRTNTQASTLVYQLSHLKTAQIKIYLHQWTVANLRYSTSPDGTNWTQVDATAGSAVNIDSEWLRQYITIGSVPDGTNYLKIEIAEGGEAWTPLIGLVVVKQ